MNKNINYFQKNLINWYDKEGRKFSWRKKSASSYKKILAEVLLQRTRAETVASFLPAFIKKYPSWEKLSSASIDELGEFLKPIGLWKRRSSSLSKLALEMKKRNGRFPSNRDGIESLPNVGQYIANAMLVFWK